MMQVLEITGKILGKENVGTIPMKEGTLPKLASQNLRPDLVYLSAQKQKQKLRQKAYRKTRVGKLKIAYSSWASTIKRKYGITATQYDEILAKQDGRCAICYNLPGKRRLAVDHNHQTNKIRGLLCYPCNYSLGIIEKLRRHGHIQQLLVYLEKE